ncbi:MAG: CoA transferase, partial [Burkholderiaceae bacterium]
HWKHALNPDVALVASPLKLSVTPVVQRHAPPTLGQHTTEVLQELLALSAGELSALRASGVIA